MRQVTNPFPGFASNTGATGYTGNTTGYTFYFVPNAEIDNDTDAFLNNISFFDADLVDDIIADVTKYYKIKATK